MIPLNATYWIRGLITSNIFMYGDAYKATACVV